MTPPLTRNLSTPEARAFWESAERTAREVETWPAWKRAGINVASERTERRQPMGDEPRLAEEGAVHFDEGIMTITLSNGRRHSVLIAKYPRLARASIARVRNYRINAWRNGIRWPDLDEDLSVAGIIRDAEKYEGSDW